MTLSSSGVGEGTLKTEPLYTIDQVAEEAGVSLTTLRRHFYAGVLPEPVWRRGDKFITRKFTGREMRAVVAAEKRLNGKRGSVTRLLEQQSM